jgi:hypothetical protein
MNFYKSVLHQIKKQDLTINLGILLGFHPASHPQRPPLS